LDNSELDEQLSQADDVSGYCQQSLKVSEDNGRSDFLAIPEQT